MTSRFQLVVAAIEAANAVDPRTIEVDGRTRAFEIVYAERMSECMDRIYPGASELLQLAARAQHIRRWEITRGDYPLGREGYNAWRKACREHHAKLTTDILLGAGYSTDETERVASFIRKERLKSDVESQALENVVGVVFVEHYLDDFLVQHADYEEAKIVGILSKTLRKMSAEGHAAALELPLTPAIRDLIGKAVAGLA